MINGVISGVCESLFDEFGENYTIFKEDITQNLKTPCFLINTIKTESKRVISNRYFKKNKFLIQYFPYSKNVNVECNDVLERLWYTLECVPLYEHLTRGTKMQGEIIDGVLNFHINYDFYVLRVKKDDDPVGVDFMEILELHIKDKERTC